LHPIRGSGARDGSWRIWGARIVFGTVDAVVSPAIAWMPCCPFSVTTRLSRNSTLRPSLASYRNGGLPAGISTQGVAKRRLRQSSVCHGLNPFDH
jgi:hypothetical protein